MMKIKIVKEGATGDALDIVNYLQNVQTPESTDDANFTVTIDGDGNITVTAGGQEFFPNYQE